MNKISNLVTVALTLSFAACQSTGVDRAQDAANAMKQQHDLLKEAPAKLDAVVASLNGLAEPGADMKKQWGAFNAAVGAADSHNAAIKDLRGRIDSHKKAFLDEWQKRLDGIPDEDLKQRAAERRDAVVQSFADMETDADAARAAFDPWWTTVKSLQAYLENDLNPSGVASVSDKMGQVTDGAPAIRSAIQEVVDELDRLARSLEAGKPPAPATDGVGAPGA